MIRTCSLAGGCKDRWRRPDLGCTYGHNRRLLSTKAMRIFLWLTEKWFQAHVRERGGDIEVRTAASLVFGSFCQAYRNQRISRRCGRCLRLAINAQQIIKVKPVKS